MKKSSSYLKKYHEPFTIFVVLVMVHCKSKTNLCIFTLSFFEVSLLCGIVNDAGNKLGNSL